MRLLLPLLLLAACTGSATTPAEILPDKVVDDPSDDAVKDAADAGMAPAEPGLVSEAATSMSVLGNGQDGKNDAGQFAMIPKIPAGDSMVEFTFVSQQSDPCIPTRKEKCPVEGTLPLVGLKFEKVKAIAYPGGDRYKLYDEGEQNEFAEGC